MKIEIDCTTFKDELSKLKDIVSSRNPMPLLANALLEAKNDTLTLQATDLEVSISTTCPCKVITEGSAALHALTLFKIISALRTEHVTVTVEDNHWASVTAEDFSCRISGFYPDDFPNIPDYQDTTFYTLDGRLLLDFVQKTAFSISTDESRPNLTGAFFRYLEKRLLVISTDGHRLARVTSLEDEFKLTDSPPEKLTEGVIIPSKGFKLLTKIIDADQDVVQFGIQNNHIIFVYKTTTVAIKLIEGIFPDFKQIIPQSLEYPAICDREKLLHAINFVKLFSNQSTHRIDLKITHNNINVFANDAETGEGTKDVAVQYDGPEVQASFKYKFFVDVLSALDIDQIEIGLSDSLTGCCIKSHQDDSSTYIIMPIRID